ncbi:MAG: hypothetical protein M1415_09195, partial [Firmicutes bacterium]|nr:hypothetical protein [Bacillota bacterium]
MTSAFIQCGHRVSANSRGSCLGPKRGQGIHERRQVFLAVPGMHHQGRRIAEHEPIPYRAMLDELLHCWC